MTSGGAPSASRDEATPWIPSSSPTGRLIAERDWSTSPLGPLDAWPAALKRAVRLCLDAPFPFAIAWGAERVQLYNDAFAAWCGAKHPSALGQDLQQCWASAWPVLGAGFSQAAAGEGAYREDGCLYLDRAGKLEEVFATFSFSPLRESDDSTRVGGVLLTLIETTAKVLAERRTALLRDVVAAGSGATIARDALSKSVKVLEGSPRDVPFAVVYSVDANGDEAELVAKTPSAPAACCPPRIDLRSHRWQLDPWSLPETLATKRYRLIDDLSHRFGAIDCGPYAEPPHSALLLPITLPGAPSPAAVLIAAQSPRLPLDYEYATFFERLGASLATSLAGAQAHEAQRRRAEQLSELDHAKTTFFSNVSHEFRTPLTLVTGPLDEELAETEQPLPERRRERLASARRNAQRLLKLVNALLDFSRLEAGRTLARFRPTPLGTLTSELAALFRGVIEQAGLMLVVEIEPLSEPVFVDRDMWEKIVLNLMSNAFKHTFEGSIEVRLHRIEEAVQLVVADTGIGIAEGELQHLFERFHRVVGAPSRTHEGTGIGLALVRELSRLHGGDVGAMSSQGRGSTFTVTIPLGSAHLPPEQLELDSAIRPAGADVSAYVHEALQWSPRARVELSEPPASGSLNEKRPKVLLADDNADMRAYVSGLLQDTYQVAAVADGQAALEQMADFEPDLVLTDVMMPRLNGIELLRALRQDEKTRAIPVILLSARAGEEAALGGLEAGADDYLTKPFSTRELLTRVRTHVALSRMRREWAEHLESTNRELEAFSYSVSHDLRTPLRAIDGFSKALLANKSAQLDDEGKDYLARVRRATTRMGELIDELLNLSRVSRAPLKRSLVSLTDLSERVVASIRERQPERHVVFGVEPDVVALADPHLLEIVLENLLDNAWKFTRFCDDAEVHVGHVVGATEPTFFIKDNGAGFDATYAHRLFQPFQRLHLERDYPGTGIGLAIVHRIIDRHNGRIWAESREAQGATFYFSLPRTT